MLDDLATNQLGKDVEIMRNRMAAGRHCHLGTCTLRLLQIARARMDALNYVLRICLLVSCPAFSPRLFHRSCSLISIAPHLATFSIRCSLRCMRCLLWWEVSEKETDVPVVSDLGQSEDSTGEKDGSQKPDDATDSEGNGSKSARPISTYSTGAPRERAASWVRISAHLWRMNLLTLRLLARIVGPSTCYVNCCMPSTMPPLPLPLHCVTWLWWNGAVLEE